MELAANKIVCLTLLLVASVGLAAGDVLENTAAVPSQANPASSSPLPKNVTSKSDDSSVKKAYTAQQDVIARYEQDIKYYESEGGAYDSVLAESLFGLGKAYQEAEDHSKAIEYFKRSWHINKINEGLYSLTQEPILREIIKSQSAMGDWEATAAGFDTLYLINARTYGEQDPRMIPLLDELTQWHLYAYVRKDKADQSHLVLSQALTSRAISLIQTHASETDLRLVNLLRFKALSSYYMAQMLESGHSVSSRSLELNRESLLDEQKERAAAVGDSYRNGRKSYEKIIKVLHSNPEVTKFDKANAYAELGDWFLLFDRRESAKRAYTDALALFDDETEKAEAHKRLFGTLHSLPTNTPINKFYQPRLGSDIFVQAKFNTTRSGYTRRTELISVEPASADTKAKRIKMKRVIRSNRFRPAFQDGNLVSRGTTVFKFKFES